MLAPECRAGGRWARGGRGGAAGRTARRWPAPSTSRRTRRAEESARAAARPPPRHLFGRAPVPLSRPAAGSRAPGPAALGRLRPPYLTSAAAPSRPSRRRGGGRRDPRPSLPRPAAARARAASQGRPRPPRSSPGGGGRGGPGARSRRSLPPFAPPLPAARPDHGPPTAQSPPRGLRGLTSRPPHQPQGRAGPWRRGRGHGDVRTRGLAVRRSPRPRAEGAGKSRLASSEGLGLAPFWGAWLVGPALASSLRGRDFSRNCE